MRSVDDATEYMVPVRRRSWTDTNGFRKRNILRAIPQVAPKRIPPEKQEGKKRRGTQRRLMSSRCPQCGLFTNFMCCEND